MTPFRMLFLLLLATVLGVSSCGKKGDPHRPGAEPEEQQGY